MHNVIEVRDLRREYVTQKGWVRRKKHVVEAVKGITFDVREGEIFGLLGQNGAGKTTTIKILITLLAPTGGTCRVLGHDTMSESKEIRGRINFIFGGELGVYRRLSARDNLRYFANLYRVEPKTAKKQIDEILALVDLSDKADLRVETYSKGMIQRLQIARGLINDPEIILMDEPTVGLDPLGARMLRDVIRRLKSHGKTVLLTTHYMYEADELCDRIAIIHDGQIVALDTPKGLKQSVKGNEAIEITVDRADPAALDRIKALTGVKALTVKECETGEIIHVSYSADTDISGPLLDTLADSRVVSWSRKELTLEDAFIILTGEGE
mgnify:FL=1